MIFESVCVQYICAFTHIYCVYNMHVCTIYVCVNTCNAQTKIVCINYKWVQCTNKHIVCVKLVLRLASRLDAFSSYPFVTLLLGDAYIYTTETQEVTLCRSSRTRQTFSQFYARSRKIWTDLLHRGLNPTHVPLSSANSRTLGAFFSPRMR